MQSGATQLSTSLTINVQGTAPTAVADIEDTTLVEDTVSVASGNVLADDAPVGAANVVLSGTNVFGSFVAVTSGGPATLQGVYGSLLLASDGAYTYTLDHTRARRRG